MSEIKTPVQWHEPNDLIELFKLADRLKDDEGFSLSLDNVVLEESAVLLELPRSFMNGCTAIRCRENALEDFFGMSLFRSIHYCDISYNDIEQIQGVEGLFIKVLIMEGATLPPHELERLHKLPLLVHLDLTETTWCDTDVLDCNLLTGFRSLTSLDLSGLTLENLDALIDTDIERLTLLGSNYDKEELSQYLQQSTTIKTVYTDEQDHDEFEDDLDEDELGVIRRPLDVEDYEF